MRRVKTIDKRKGSKKTNCGLFNLLKNMGFYYTQLQIERKCVVINCAAHSAWVSMRAP